MSGIHSYVGIHECAIEIATKIDRIRGANILDNGIEHVERGKFPLGSGLAQLESVFRRHLVLLVYNLPFECGFPALVI